MRDRKKYYDFHHNCFMCDFETNKRENVKKGFPHVYLISMKKLYENSFIDFTNIYKWWDYLVENTYTDTIIYFQNGSKFDIWYLNYFLIVNQGIEPINYIPNRDRFCEFLDRKISFYAFIDEHNCYKEMLIYLPKNRCFISVRCSYLLLRLSVEDMGGKSFLIDYEKPRNYKNLKQVPKKELDYIHEDVLVVAKVLENMFKYEKIESLTIATHIRKILEKENADVFNEIYNQFDMDFYDKIAKPSCQGGYVYCNPKYQGKIINQKVYCYDFNSFYPWVMVNFPLPFGKPSKTKSKDHTLSLHELFIVKVDCYSYMHPFINCSNDENSAKAYNRHIENIRVVLWKNELDLFKDSYHGSYVEGSVYWFKTTTFLAKFIKETYNLRLKAKASGNRGLDILYKNYMNHCGGRFSLNPKLITKQWVKEKNNYCRTVGEFSLVKFDNETLKLDYIPIFSYITSIARTKLLKINNMLGVDNVLGNDSDSIKSLKELPPSYLSQTELGKLKVEKIATKFVYKRKKSYGMEYYKDGKLHKEIICSGLAKDVRKNMSIEEFATTKIVRNGDLASVFADGNLWLETKDFHFLN